MDKKNQPNYFQRVMSDDNLASASRWLMFGGFIYVVVFSFYAKYLNTLDAPTVELLKWVLIIVVAGKGIKDISKAVRNDDCK